MQEPQLAKEKYMYLIISVFIWWYLNSVETGLYSDIFGTSKGPTIKDSDRPTLFIINDTAVLVVLWRAGNHVVERSGAPATATGPATRK